MRVSTLFFCSTVALAAILFSCCSAVAQDEAATVELPTTMDLDSLEMQPMSFAKSSDNMGYIYDKGAFYVDTKSKTGQGIFTWSTNNKRKIYNVTLGEHAFWEGTNGLPDLDVYDVEINPRKGKAVKMKIALSLKGKNNRTVSYWLKLPSSAPNWTRVAVADALYVQGTGSSTSGGGGGSNYGQ